MLPVLAQAGQDIGGVLFQFLPLVVIGAIFYLMLLRPMRKRQKDHEKMIGALSAGDKVVTNGGLEGTITRVDETRVKVRLAPGTEVTVLRSHIAGKSEEDSP